MADVGFDMWLNSLAQQGYGPGNHYIGTAPSAYGGGRMEIAPSQNRINMVNNPGFSSPYLPASGSVDPGFYGGFSGGGGTQYPSGTPMTGFTGKPYAPQTSMGGFAGISKGAPAAVSGAAPVMKPQQGNDVLQQLLYQTFGQQMSGPTFGGFAGSGGFVR